MLIPSAPGTGTSRHSEYRFDVANTPGKVERGRKRIVLRKQLKQNCPHRELRDEALTGEPCRLAACMPKSSSSAKGIDMNTTIPPPRYPPAFCTLNMMTRLACSDCTRSTKSGLCVVLDRMRKNSLLSTGTTSSDASPRPASQTKVYLKPYWRAYRRPLTIC
jgi:hypothetical protein